MEVLETVDETRERLQQDILVNCLEDAGLEEEETCEEMIQCYLEMCDNLDEIDRQLLKKSIYEALLESRHILPPIDQGWLTDE